ncbi:uncharacterized protein BDZ83DRAFT_634225 [Colletotrichum acutatum]|uniref:Uncharacterized protein n=1 Tax=Glomerella acutata TaxID=27357 RepID=A0AAD8UHD6_GLOAC|nr:uncharacterized protein BDZ83DRAFT_634225 [Colletotrichum acutatum]KAK1716795.1 hypothetical protein BDZ83DRAFT_634225 [Colletotrichum acutatum]
MFIAYVSYKDQECPCPGPWTCNLLLGVRVIPDLRKRHHSFTNMSTSSEHQRPASHTWLSWDSSHVVMSQHRLQRQPGRHPTPAEDARAA